MKVALFLNIFLSLYSICPINAKYTINAGIPIVAPICKYSLCALSTYLLYTSA